MEKRALNQYEIEEKLNKWCFYGKNYSAGYAQWVNFFGAPSIFYKLSQRVSYNREIVCPRCGKKGVITLKITISKRKYRYRKLYVYHETKSPMQYTRIQKWCYLNKIDLNDVEAQKTIQRWVHALNIEEWFYRCLILP